MRSFPKHRASLILIGLVLFCARSTLRGPAATASAPSQPSGDILTVPAEAARRGRDPLQPGASEGPPRQSCPIIIFEEDPLLRSAAASCSRLVRRAPKPRS